MAGVQSYECVERRSKQVGADRQSVVIDQLAPLHRGHSEKQTSQENCREPEEFEKSHAISIESALSEHDSHAAREQKDRGEHRQIQHLAWSRTRQTLADIKDVARDEDREKSGLSQDQADERELSRGRRHALKHGDGGEAEPQNQQRADDHEHGAPEPLIKAKKMSNSRTTGWSRSARWASARW